MTKAELIAQIAAKANLTKAAAERSVNAMLESIQEFLAEDGKLTLTGFGTFAVEERQAERCRELIPGGEPGCSRRGRRRS